MRQMGNESPAARSAISRPTALIVNRAQPAEARRVANLLHDLSGRFLGGKVRLRAAIQDDPAVARSIRHQQPLCVVDPQSRAAAAIDILAQELWSPAAVSTASRSGINEEVEHAGRRLHVQTEDLGATQGAVRTQIFLSDGSVLFTRRTPYVDAFFLRLGVGAADRTRFHHVAIVRALQAGRIDPLRKSA